MSLVPKSALNTHKLQKYPKLSDISCICIYALAVPQLAGTHRLLVNSISSLALPLAITLSFQLSSITPQAIIKGTQDAE